jgi:hypothetical protein
MAQVSWEDSERRRCNLSLPEALPAAIGVISIDPLWHAERDARH